jgi:hypothetical protein
MNIRFIQSINNEGLGWSLSGRAPTTALMWALVWMWACGQGAAPAGVQELGGMPAGNAGSAPGPGMSLDAASGTDLDGATSAIPDGPSGAPDAGAGNLDATRSAALSFAPPASYDVGNAADIFFGNAAAIDIVTGDLNGDGKPDLAVIHAIDNTIYILLNKGDGTFEAGAKYAVAGPLHDGFLADFNGDGKLDIAVPGGATAGNNFVEHATVLLGNGDGTFKAAVDSSSFGDARGLNVGDFNHDGKLDMVANNPVDGTVSVLLGKGDGTFQPRVVSPSAPAFPYSRWVTVGDFNTDGKLDLAIADGQGVMNQVGTTETTVLLGNGDATYTLAAHYPTLPTLASWGGAPAPVPGGPTVNPEDVVALDVNGDGKLDLVESLYDHNINVFIGKGDGTFEPAAAYIPGEYPRSVAAADMDGDGIVDLVVGNVGCAPNTASCLTANGSVAVLLGNGGGTFQAPVQLTPFPYPGWVVVSDFNGDGRPDIAVTRVMDGHSVDVILNTTGK